MVGALILSQNGLQGVDMGSCSGGLHSTGFPFAWQPGSHHASRQSCAWHACWFPDAVQLTTLHNVDNVADRQFVPEMFILCSVPFNGKHVHSKDMSNGGMAED